MSLNYAKGRVSNEICESYSTLSTFTDEEG